MRITDSKIAIGALCFISGAAMMLAAQKISRKDGLKSPPSVEQKSLSDQRAFPSFDSFLNDDVFDNARNPFEQLQKMNEKMQQQFASLDPSSRALGEDINTREDKHYIYFDIAVQDLKKEKFKVKVENGMISISGVIEKKSENGDDSSSFFSSSFHRSFPVPQGVDAAKMEVEQQKDKWVVKLPKIDTQNA